MQKLDKLWNVLRYERGFALWAPALLVCCYMVLFGVRQAPSVGFNKAFEIRIAIGPWESSLDDRNSVAQLTHALGERLHERSLAVVPADRVRRRVETMLGERPSRDPRQWMQASRHLNARYFLSGELQSAGRQAYEARLAVWEAATRQPLHNIQVRGFDFESLGQACADSVEHLLFGGPAAFQHSSR